MQPGPRARTRRRRLIATSTPGTTGAALPEQEIPAPEPEPESVIIDATSLVLEETTQPLTTTESSTRTDFYFPPLPLEEPDETGQAASTALHSTQRVRASQRMQGGLHRMLAFSRVVWRGIRRLAAFVAQQYRHYLYPLGHAIWHWMTYDPYAPPKIREQALLQGRVLGVYRYRLYQRIILGMLGGIPLATTSLYILYRLLDVLFYGLDSRLFLVQDLAGACTGFFGSLLLIRLATTRITLRSDGIEYKTMFRLVRSRWEEIGVVKVEYYRRSERWIVGTGRGTWAFLYRSLLGLPKGRQLAKLITIYARLKPTGTPYWLPAAGRFTEDDPLSRTTEAPSEQEKQETRS